MALWCLHEEGATTNSPWFRAHLEPSGYCKINSHLCAILKNYYSGTLKWQRENDIALQHLNFVSSFQKTKASWEPCLRHLEIKCCSHNLLKPFNLKYPKFYCLNSLLLLCLLFCNYIYIYMSLICDHHNPESYWRRNTMIKILEIIYNGSFIWL